MSIPVDDLHEWLEPDGRGGFASGTVSGLRTRCHHALLVHAGEPLAERLVLVNGFDAWIETPNGQYAISGQRYTPDVIYPDGALRLVDFTPDPWPRWQFRLEDGTHVSQDLFIPAATPAVAVAWRLVASRPGVYLRLRPFISCRPCETLQRENPDFDGSAQGGGERIVWSTYPGMPAIVSLANAAYAPDPTWYRNFLYKEEQARGLDCTEDLASPGVLTFELSAGPAAWVLAVDGPTAPAADADPVALVTEWRQAEERRRRYPSRLHRAADAYVVARCTGYTIIAGYPWFTDWGRDTFVAVRGLCLATGRLADARAILLAWAETLSDGMLPNRFPDAGGAPPEYNAVDAALWYVVAVHELLAAAAAQGTPLPGDEQARLADTVEAILTGYARGTRHGIRCDADGLLAAGVPGVQLTWMDAKVDDWVVTPRIGKPVEVQALWLNALWVGSQRGERWAEVLGRGWQAFAERFWNPARQCLYDVVDCEHQAGACDGSLRPNQIFAVGGLPLALLDGERARQVVDVVEQHLWTPHGLRSLAPDESGYAPRCGGDARARHAAYHQGSAWPWLAGPFIEAWVRVHGNGDDARHEARRRFFEPLLQALDVFGLGHICQIADAESPHTPRGCPFQAWSVGEALRLQETVLAG